MRLLIFLCLILFSSSLLFSQDPGGGGTSQETSSEGGGGGGGGGGEEASTPVAMLELNGYNFGPQTNVFIPGILTQNLTKLTVEAWVNSTYTGNTIQAIVSAAGPEFVHLQMSGDGNVHNAVYLNDGGSLMLPVIPSLSPGWHHVALVVESGNSKVFLDGQQVGNTDTSTFSAITPAESVFIGKGWAGQRAFNGKIADVRIWKNRALTQAEIEAYRFTPPPVDAPGLVFHLF